MTEICFVTSNNNKIKEVQPFIKNQKIISLQDLNFNGDIKETEKTFKGNSFLKADFIYKKYKINCFSDDSGLEVEALNNTPGVLSARYAGKNASSNDNIELLLKNLKGIKNRRARFITSICLIIDSSVIFFEGVVLGTIIDHKSGNNGFGYDPVFIPDGYNKTFSKMPFEFKNSISHRSIAIKKLVNYINALS
jgi:XTP/dITP diphosphohydrolase|tara:strand:- start:172 stop:750 length:579 start_codon:yes stop_codon:yes gene_type:complete